MLTLTCAVPAAKIHMPERATGSCFCLPALETEESEKRRNDGACWVEGGLGGALASVASLKEQICPVFQAAGQKLYRCVCVVSALSTHVEKVSFFSYQNHLSPELEVSSSFNKSRLVLLLPGETPPQRAEPAPPPPHDKHGRRAPVGCVSR